LVVELGRDLVDVHVEEARTCLHLTLGERAQVRDGCRAIGLGSWHRDLHGDPDVL
jgi:hypothetical protein